MAVTEIKMLIPTWKGEMDDPTGSGGKGEARILPSALRGCPGGRAEGRLKVLPKCYC